MGYRDCVRFGRAPSSEGKNVLVTIRANSSYAVFVSRSPPSPECSQQSIDRWISERAGRIRTQNPQVVDSEVHRWLTAALESHLLAPSSAAETARLLRHAADRLSGRVTSYQDSLIRTHGPGQESGAVRVGTAQ